MNHCDGWIGAAHKTTDFVVPVIIPGCRYCGGADCGDTGDELMLCPKCFEDYQTKPGLTAVESLKRLEETNK